MEQASTKESETNRDRVRRVVFEPLGFRLKRGTDAAAHKVALGRLADDLAYLTDRELLAVQEWAQTNGDGKTKDIWPALGRFRGIAQLVRPRPVAELPGLRSWFGSIEGPKAQADGTLVETFKYFQRRRLPPRDHGARLWVKEQVSKNQRRLEIIDDRLAGGWSVAEEELRWRDWYLAKRAELDALVAEFQRGQSEGAA